MSALLDVHGLHAGYGDAKVLHGVNLEVAANGITAIVGANGAGKTTLFRVLAGLLGCDAGTVTYAGRPLLGRASHQRVADGVVLVPEGRLVFADMSVAENLRMGALNRRARAALHPNLDTVYEMFPRLLERRRQAAGTLSGGEQQMLALGRGLMGQPRLLLLDEPTLGLAPAMAKQIFDTVTRFATMGIAVLLAEQDVYRTLQIAGRAYVLEHGRVTRGDTGANLLRDPSVREAYLGVSGTGPVLPGESG